MIDIAVDKLLKSHNGSFHLDIHLQIRKGNFTALAGKSGVGKTSLLKILAGLIEPDDGRILHENEVWFDKGEKVNLAPQKRLVGFVFQDYALFPHMSVAQNIGYALKVARVPRKEREEHYYNPKHSGLIELGLKPTFMTDDVIAGMLDQVKRHSNRIDRRKIMPRVTWSQGRAA